jgi:hypothetical protein
VAFESYAGNLVENDTNGTLDIFVHDRLTGITERVSVDSSGMQGNSTSQNASLSADGRYVAFESYAGNLIATDTNGAIDVFVHDRLTGITERASVDSSGMEGNSSSRNASLSADGRYVAFESYAGNLVATDTNGAIDVFVHDRLTGITERVSVDSSGMQGNSSSQNVSLSADGQYVGFVSYASNLVSADINGYADVFVHKRGKVNNPPIADAGSDQTVNCSGPGGAIVTLDGSNSSDPDEDSLIYSWEGPFQGPVSGVQPQVNIPLGTHVITLRADDGKGGTAEDTVVITVGDTIPPSTTATIGATSGIQNAAAINEWYRTDVTVDLVSTDNCTGCEKVYTILDGVSAVAAGNSANMLISLDGIHELSYWAVDGSGNTESQKSLIIKLDRTPPIITAVTDPSPNAQGWNNTDVTVTFVCRDSVSGIAFCPSPITVSNKGAGQIISGTAMDNAGNSATVSATVNIDKKSPVTRISATPKLLWPANGKMVKVWVKGDISDSSRISSIVVKVKDEYGKVQPSVNTLNAPIFLEARRNANDRNGRHYIIEAVVTDIAGNTSMVKTEVIVPHDMKHDGKRKHDGKNEGSRNDNERSGKNDEKDRSHEKRSCTGEMNTKDKRDKK